MPKLRIDRWELRSRAIPHVSAAEEWLTLTHLCDTRVVESAWAQSELPEDEIDAWRAAGASNAVCTMELIEAGWTADMANLAVNYQGSRSTIARAVSDGMSLDEAERALSRIQMRVGLTTRTSGNSCIGTQCSTPGPTGVSTYPAP
jgi:hypothetical protein